MDLSIFAALKAGKAIMELYDEKSFQIQNKSDESPLTTADKEANRIINSCLISSKIPIISEENQQIDYSIRKSWTLCWIVDPLDGTKEFIKHNGEFTVNIALVQEGKPKLGVIFAPALQILYFGDVEMGKAYKINLDLNKDLSLSEIHSHAIEIKPEKGMDLLKIVGSRSHMNEETLEFIRAVKRISGKKVEIIFKGSSLKLCLVAEGEAQIYPRFAPTMEWDTAAGHAICEAVGIQVKTKTSGKSLLYNKEKLLNPQFVVNYEG